MSSTSLADTQECRCVFKVVSLQPGRVKKVEKRKKHHDCHSLFELKANGMQPLQTCRKFVHFDENEHLSRLHPRFLKPPQKSFEKRENTFLPLQCLNHTYLEFYV